MKSTFRILFYAKWEASDEAKMLPIYVRITINGTKARFSLKIRVSEKIWDAKSGRAIGYNDLAALARELFCNGLYLWLMKSQHTRLSGSAFTTRKCPSRYRASVKNRSQTNGCKRCSIITSTALPPP